MPRITRQKGSDFDLFISYWYDLSLLLEPVSFLYQHQIKSRVPRGIVNTHQHSPTKCTPAENKNMRNGLALLLADTDGASTAAGSLGVLTTDTQTPVVTQTTVGADLLQALEILTELAVQTVGQNLGVLAVGDVALSVEEPGGDLVLGGVLEDGDDTLEFFGGELTSAVSSQLLLLSNRHHSLHSLSRSLSLVDAVEID